MDDELYAYSVRLLMGIYALTKRDLWSFFDLTIINNLHHAVSQRMFIKHNKTNQFMPIDSYNKY